MNYILLGAAGFLLMHLLDLASLKKLPLVKPALALSGTALVVYASAMAAVSGERFELPLSLTLIGWVLLAVSACLMVYSLYVVLPFGKTYLATGLSGQLVTGGVYRLVRHPWLLFFALSMAGLTIGSRSLLALEAGVVWTALSAGLVFLQDRMVFPRMFPGYAEYQRRTPMLLPTKNSLSAFFKGLKQNKVSEV
jgi:protein-S-isoprenylcysteine O-methyltransferase Ste14